MNAFPEPGKGADTRYGLSKAARDLQWLLSNLIDDVPGVRSVAVVSSDGLPLLASDPGLTEAVQDERADGKSTVDLATIVSGLSALTDGLSQLMNGGEVKQTMIAMTGGSFLVMAIGDGSVLGVYAAQDCDMSLVAYHMTLFVRRAGHALTPELRSELRRSREMDG